jgi:hypothetical protein
MQKNKFAFFTLLILSLALPSVVEAKAADDEHIRQIVMGLLKEKDRKIEQLEARIQQLEQERRATPVAVVEAGAQNKTAATVDSAPPKLAADVTGKTVASNDTTVTGKLRDLTKKVDELKSAAHDNGLDIGGFFDINAKTGNSTDQTFSVGLLELDIAYAYDEHFAASSALVLCGNSSGADFATTPAHISCGNSSLIGAGSGSAAIAVGLIDFHLFDSSIPPRGRIFDNQGFHLQAGRFDLPFSSDYQNFANKDRVTITSPITTVRMQKGGFNGDGVRSYGSWDMFNYSVFWTNGVYENAGTSLGGRLGMSLGKNTFRIHGNSPEGIEFGVSHLSELDGHNNIRNTFYGADLSIGYGMLRLQNELMLLQSHQSSPIFAVTGSTIGFGKAHQLGYHSTLIADMEGLIKRPVLAFARYGRWQPKQHFGVDGFDGSVVGINDISLLSLGFNYKFSDNLRIKFEYTDSLGTETQEHFFDKKLGMAQMVVAF